MGVVDSQAFVVQIHAGGLLGWNAVGGMGSMDQNV